MIKPVFLHRRRTRLLQRINLLHRLRLDKLLRSSLFASAAKTHPLRLCKLRHYSHSPSNRRRCISGSSLLEPRRPNRLQHHFILGPLFPSRFLCSFPIRPRVHSRQSKI